VGPRPKRYPTRTCVACRTSRQKRDLVRVVRTPDGQVVLDATGRLAGRGAYLCADGSCWRQAIEKGTLQRALDVPLPEELKHRLRAGSDVSGERAAGSVPVRIAATSATIDEMNEGEAIGQE
jgi:predicted RNA-binding protein YlxR (DUF448 family)